MAPDFKGINSPVREDQGQDKGGLRANSRGHQPQVVFLLAPGFLAAQRHMSSGIAPSNHFDRKKAKFHDLLFFLYFICHKKYQRLKYEPTYICFTP